MDERYWHGAMALNTGMTIILFGLFASALVGKSGYLYAALFLGAAIPCTYIAFAFLLKRNGQSAMDKLIDKTANALANGYSEMEVRQAMAEVYDGGVIDEVFRRIRRG